MPHSGFCGLHPWRHTQSCTEQPSACPVPAPHLCVFSFTHLVNCCRIWGPRSGPPQIINTYWLTLGKSLSLTSFLGWNGELDQVVSQITSIFSCHTLGVNVNYKWWYKTGQVVSYNLGCCGPQWCNLLITHLSTFMPNTFQTRKPNLS